MAEGENTGKPLEGGGDEFVGGKVAVYKDKDAIADIGGLPKGDGNLKDQGE